MWLIYPKCVTLHYFGSSYAYSNRVKLSKVIKRLTRIRVDSFSPWIKVVTPQLDSPTNALVLVFHGKTIGPHTNECTLVNDVMTLTEVFVGNEVSY